jgi:hypothetical protein
MITQIKKVLKLLYFKSYPNPMVSRVRAAVSSFDAELRSEYRSMEGKMVSTLSPDLSVLSGPFKGMKYPLLKAGGSALLPKLLGTYEIELHPFIEKIIKKNYSIILNIGSAEGYYAVGLAGGNPATKIAAFDIDPRARELLSEMIRRNNVHDRVMVEGLCDAHVLNSFAYKKNGLVLSDCEGYELDLFTTTTIKHLRHFDFLVETHDSLSVNITGALSNRFRETHNIRLIKGRKRSVKDFPASSAFTSMEKLLAMQEGRHRIPKWLFLKSLSN